MASTVEKLRLRIYLAIFLGVMVIGTLGFMVAEGLSLVDAAYFTIVTIATVGYGDIAPATTLGKALDIFLIVAGVGTFVGVVANATETFVARRERQRQVQKLHMLIGLFFSELGTDLLRICAQADPDPDILRRHLLVAADWPESRFRDVRSALSSHTFQGTARQLNFFLLRSLLDEKGEMLVRLLESPFILEHEAFSDLLVATLHLKEELLHRPEDFDQLPEKDLHHLEGDVNRVYGLLARQWLDYLEHLKGHYPYLFSLAVRTNPFNPDASPVVTG